MKSIAILFAVLAVFLWVTGESVSHAYTFSFTDNTYYWGDSHSGNWGNGAWSSDDAPGWSCTSCSPDNSYDVIGDPDITGGGGTIDSSGQLTEIYFDYSTWGSQLSPGDLFIDIGANRAWEYVVTPEGKVYSVPQISALRPSSWNPDNDYYQDSNEVFGQSVSDPNNWDWRNDHPVKADFNIIEGESEVPSAATFSYFDNNTGTPATFSNLDINLQGEDFIIAWAPTCANDVVYEKVPNPVPEPGTNLLVGIGLLGLGIFGRKRLSKKNYRKYNS